MSDQNISETAQTGKPPCYSDRPTWKASDRYMFVSYAHLDSDAVYEDLRALYAKCLNYWYDKKLKAGDPWDESVAEVIRNEQCCGIILYLSVNTVRSAAVEQELRIYKEIIATGREFLLIPVSVSGGNVNSIVRAAYSDPQLAELSEKEFDLKLPQERAANVLTTLPSNMLYIPRSPSDLSHVDRIVEELQKHEADVFCDNDSSLDKLSRLSCVAIKDGVVRFTLGSYPQKQCLDPKRRKNDQKRRRLLPSFPVAVESGGDRRDNFYCRHGICHRLCCVQCDRKLYEKFSRGMLALGRRKSVHRALLSGGHRRRPSRLPYRGDGILPGIRAERLHTPLLGAGRKRHHRLFRLAPGQ